MIKLCLIIDGEESFLRNKVEEVYKQWGYVRSSVREQTEWKGPQRGKSLFGDEIIIHLNLQDKNDMKKFVTQLSDKKLKDQFTKDDWYGNGLIISCSTAQGAKKIQDLITKFKGVFYKKENNKTRKNDLLKELSLPSDSKKIVEYYVGEDYTLLLSFVKEIKKLSKEQQKNITQDNVLTYFPPIPGNVLPWEFMNPLMDGNTAKALHEFNRTVKTSHVLVPMLFLQRQISQLLRIAIARIDIPNNPKKLAESIGEKAYGGFWPLYKVATRTKISNIEKASLEVLKLENDIKGNSQVDPEVEFRTTIAKLGMLLNH